MYAYNNPIIVPKGSHPHREVLRRFMPNQVRVLNSKRIVRIEESTEEASVATALVDDPNRLRLFPVPVFVHKRI